MTEEIINADGSRNWEANILFDNIKRLEQENKHLNDLLNQALKEQEEFRIALEEIREIAEKAVNSNDCYVYMYAGKMYCKPILNKINEVLG